jgi:hypothetical protein
MKALSSRTFLPLLLGDLAALAVMTVIGQQSHSTLDQGFSRFLVNFLPFALAWVAAAFCLEAYNPERLARYTELWRPFAAMILAAPLGGVLRALVQDSVVMPVFVIAFGGMSALALLAWRFGYAAWSASLIRKSRVHG